MTYTAKTRVNVGPNELRLVAQLHEWLSFASLPPHPLPPIAPSFPTSQHSLPHSSFPPSLLPLSLSPSLSSSLPPSLLSTFLSPCLPPSQVELILPSSGPVGSLIEIAGYRLPNAAHTYDRLYLGDLQCNHFDNETNQPYGIRWYSSKRHIKCAVENQMTGGYNASIQFRDWANPRGQSWNGSKAMYLMYDGSLAMYELYPGQCKVLW